MNRPWYRPKLNTWYVTLDGRQVTLGKDPRFETAPKKTPKEPPGPILRKYNALVARSTGQVDRDLPFSVCVALYLASLKDCTRTTQRQAKMFLERFLTEQGDRPVTALRAHHVTAFLEGKTWTQNTRHNAVARIHACLNHCVREDHLDANPLKGKVQIPPVERRELRLTAGEQEAMVAAAAGPFRSFLHALKELGCRPGELCGARVEQLDLEKGVLKVENKTRKKTGVKLRTIVLTAPMRDLCRELAAGRAEGFLFRNHFGGPWKKSAVRNRMVKLCNLLGIERVPYEFRHRWCTDALNVRGVNPAVVALQMGHTNLQTMMKHYVHADPEAMRKALEGGAG